MRRFSDGALAVLVGLLMLLATPVLSAPVLSPSAATPAAGAALHYAGIARETSSDEAAWNAIKNSRNPAVFEAFISSHPDSPYVGQAQQRAQQLRPKAERPTRKASSAPSESGGEKTDKGEKARASTAPAGPVTLEVASPYAEKDFRTRNLKSYTDAVTAEVDGAVNFVIFPAGGLLQHGQIPAGLGNNEAALGVFDLSRLAAEAPVLALSSLPFVAASYEDAFHLWKAAQPVVQRLLAERGMMALYAIPAVPAGLFAKKAVRSAADLKGLRIAASDDWLKRLVGEVGGRPSEGTVADAVKQAADGGIDGMLAPLDAAAANKAWSGFAVAYDVQASFPLSVVAISQSAYATLSPEVQRALFNSAVSAQNAAWSDSIDERNANVDQLGKENLTVQAPPQALVSELKAASNPQLKSWLAATGNDGQAILSASESSNR